MTSLNEYRYPAKILRVVDGDTIDVELTLADVDLGFGITVIQKHRVKLRLAGINAPETSTKEGKDASIYLKSILPEGGTCTVVTVKDRAEKYGRYLAWVWQDGVCINDRIVADGHAVIYNPSNLPRPA